MQELQGTLVALWLSATGSQYKTVVCEETSSASSTANVNTTKTKCGTFSTVDTPETTITGSGVVDGNPAANQASYKQLHDWLLAKQNLYAIYKTAADASVGETSGESVYMDGRGYLSEVTVTAQEGDVIKFNWAFTFTGTVDTSADS
jgi:hypothetical protein